MSERATTQPDALVFRNELLFDGEGKPIDGALEVVKSCATLVRRIRRYGGSPPDKPGLLTFGIDRKVRPISDAVEDVRPEAIEKKQKIAMRELGVAAANTVLVENTRSGAMAATWNEIAHIILVSDDRDIAKLVPWRIDVVPSLSHVPNCLAAIIGWDAIKPDALREPPPVAKAIYPR